MRLASMTNGPPPKPMKLKALLGNPGHQSKEKLNLSQPDPTPLSTVPEPPDFLVEHAAQEWRRIAPEVCALGLLTTVDLAAMGAFCQAFGRWRMAEEAWIADGCPFESIRGNGNSFMSPTMTAANQAMREMMRCAAEFGFTPSSRSRVRLKEDGKQVPKFDDLVA